MSNLSSSVLFDVVRGWPHGGAVDESFPVATGVTVKEGELVILDSTGAVTHAASVPTEADPAAPLKLYLVIQGNDQWDAQFVGKVVVLRGDVTIETEKFVAGAYTPGELVTISVAAGSEGYIAQRTVANEQIVGVVEAYDSTAGKLTVALSL
jgi:hypothetical protein